MPEPAPLDVSIYLVPISEQNPSGESLRYEDDYAKIETAREEEVDTGGSDRWKKSNPKKADWEAVITLGLKLLKEKSKDLEITGWITEALCRRRGLAGLRDGLRLLRAIQETFWATAHPDDPELREGVFEFLDDEKRLPLLIRSSPLVAVSGLPPYSLLKYKESREVKNILLKEPDRESSLKDEGKLLPEDFDTAVDATERSFYESTFQRLTECQEATDQLNQSIRAPEHYGKKGPALAKTNAALDEVTKLVQQFLARKPAPEPEFVEESTESESDDSPDADPPEEQPTVEAVVPRRATSKPVRSTGGAISSTEDARGWIVAAAKHLREADASDPVPYLVVRSLRMGELYRSPNSVDSSALEAPSTEDRQSLRRLLVDSSWAELLEQTELILSRPEGTGWLDARRLALKALVELGQDNAAKAAMAILGAELRDYPEWPLAELNDGTPCAGTETRAWIEESFAPETNREPEKSVDSYTAHPLFQDETALGGSTESDRPPDAWEEAQRLHRDGRSQEAVALLGHAVREAKTGRDRFLRTFQQAELCMMMGRSGIATPLLEGLTRQIDEFRLDRWEDPALCARVIAALYRCLRGKDEVRAKAIYDRLCQLDIALAINFLDGTET